MNTITLHEVGLKPFELNLQNLHFMIKSLAMFPEYEEVLSMDDDFYIAKDSEYGYLLSHHSNKMDMTRYILCFQSPDQISRFGRDKVSLFHQLFEDAWKGIIASRRI